ncbi:MAG: hypothetical protein QOH03_1966 [Kribbellaceae bacterium]|jgi:hypothetical protein|nr:hypothetical protein [Kribbellaceae bacterium]
MTVDGYVLVVPAQWKNDHVFYAAAFRDENSRLDLLTCSNQTTCDTTLKSFAMPLGDKSTTQFPNGLPVQ